jgi:hypothetical protein
MRNDAGVRWSANSYTTPISPNHPLILELTALSAEVCRLYERDWKRKPKLAELLGTIEAVLETQLQDHTSDGDTNEIDSIN